MRRIEDESRKRGVILHWGQRNTRTQEDIEKVFAGKIDKWRDVLSILSQHGRLANFSTPDSRIKGLEIKVPRLYGLGASLTDGCAEELTTISYDGYNNPPLTRLELVQEFKNGAKVEVELPDLKGSVSLPLGEGRSTLYLFATRTLNGKEHTAPPMQVELQGYRTGDTWEFKFEAEQRLVAGALRWFVDINLFSQSISNQLRVSEVELTASAGMGWIMRNPEIGEVTLAGLTDTHVLAIPAVFNTSWQFRSVAAAMGTVPPVLTIRFKIVC